MAGHSDIHPITRFWELLQLDRKDIFYIYLNSIFAGLIGLVLPLGVQAIIGMIAGGGFSTSLVILISVVTIGTALSGILKIMQISITETLQRRIFVRSSFDFSYRLPRLKLDATTKDYLPELVNRFFDTQNVQKGMPKILIDFSEALFNIIFGIILISFYHPFFAFFGLFLVLALFLVYRVSGTIGLQTSLAESKYKYEVAHWLEEIARSLPSFKMAGYTPYPLRRTDELVSKYLDHRGAHFRVLKFQYGVIVAFKVVFTAALMALGSILVLDNQINIGEFVAAEIVVILVIGSTEKVIMAMDTIYDVLTALDKLGIVTDLPIEKENGLRFDRMDTGQAIKIQADNLSFQFAGTALPVVKNVTLEINSGQRVCISGAQSGGKSTLLHLLAGMYSDFEGTISYNGFPIKSLDLCSLRGHIGEYLSDVAIFRGTILENITLGNPELPLANVVQIAEELGVAEYIRNLPEGYQTQLIPEGRNLPRTVRTKIILARAVVDRPRLLVVEDFFEQLEFKDTAFIANFLTRKDQPWTLITVSNDSVLASKCDRLLFLQDGEIVADGTWGSLYKDPLFDQVFGAKQNKSPI
jgi:ABC-type bacteriocin/lantibiotic exporter with double-glycine peptidase domain